MSDLGAIFPACPGCGEAIYKVGGVTSHLDEVVRARQAAFVEARNALNDYYLSAGRWGHHPELAAIEDLVCSHVREANSPQPRIKASPPPEEDQ